MNSNAMSAIRRCMRWSPSPWRRIGTSARRISTSIIAVTARVIGDGVAVGRIPYADLTVTALCVLTAMLRFIHPQLIAEFADKPSATLDQMIDFVLTALRAPKP